VDGVAGEETRNREGRGTAIRSGRENRRKM